jgi:arylsulfatase
MGIVSNINTGYPNRRGNITHHAATIAEMLRDEDYATFCTGKWHLANTADTSMAGPFDQWPLQRGFDRFYGFLEGETDQFYPQLTYDNHYVDPPCGPEDGYHVTEDLVDKSMEFIRDLKSVRPDRPFFLYLAFGATHAPHQAPADFLEKYKGRFDQGWDEIRKEWYENQLELGIIPKGTELAPRNEGVEPWDDLSENQKRFALKLQEAFAGFLDHTDHHIGRLVSFLEEMGEMDNTIIILTSDNGASQEGGATGVMDEAMHFMRVQQDVDEVQSRIDEIGGPHSHSNYPWGWAQAGNTPLKWYKQNTFGGGVRDPLIIHWPGHVNDKGGIRHQFHHVTDIVPTILELLDIEAKDSYCGYDQIPITGTSMVYTFDAPDEKTLRGPQYFEMGGHRGIWADGWKAVTYHRAGAPFTDDEWELYHLDEDFSETHDLATEDPEKLREMIELWWIEASRHGVLPLENRNQLSLFREGRFRPGSPHQHGRYVYYPPISHIPMAAAPAFGARSWTMTAEVERGNDSVDGVLAAHGTQNTGFSWYIKDRRLVFDSNALAKHFVVRSEKPVPVGKSTLGVAFTWTENEGTITLLVDGEECGAIQVPTTIRTYTTGMSIGRDALSPVTDDYQAPFPFKGTISRIEVTHQPYRSALDEQRDRKARQKAEMARQ